MAWQHAGAHRQRLGTCSHTALSATLPRSPAPLCRYHVQPPPFHGSTTKPIHPARALVPKAVLIYPKAPHMLDYSSPRLTHLRASHVSSHHAPQRPASMCLHNHLCPVRAPITSTTPSPAPPAGLPLPPPASVAPQPYPHLRASHVSSPSVSRTFSSTSYRVTGRPSSARVAVSRHLCVGTVGAIESEQSKAP